MVRRGIKRSLGEQAFDALNLIVLGLVGLLALYPFLYILTMSLSPAAEASRSSLHLFPSRISFDAYRVVFRSPDIVFGLRNSLVRTVLGTVLTLLATCVAAYPLAQRKLPNRASYLRFILFTMLFSGGTVPVFLVVRSLGLINSVWSLILPGLLTAFNVLVVKNFFEQIPASLHESATIDGASEWNTLFRIYVPLSRPVLATVALWTAVAHWNQWLDALLYITDDKKQVLQIFLQRIVVENSTMLTDMGGGSAGNGSFTPETVKAATVIITILPMIALYPFVQRHFVKGILLGGVKE